MTVRRSFDGRLMGQSWETPFVELPDGPIDESMIAQMIELFHEQYERRYGNRFEFVPVQGVTYRVQLIVPSEKVEYVPLEAAAETSILADRMLELRYFEDSVRSRWASTGARTSRSEPGSTARRSSARISRRRFVCPRQVAEIGRFGEIVIEQVERVSTTPA